MFQHDQKILIIKITIIQNSINIVMLKDLVNFIFF
jgi:hypothetical protein